MPYTHEIKLYRTNNTGPFDFNFDITGVECNSVSNFSNNLIYFPFTVTKPPTASGQDQPRVAYVFTTELANKAAAAVRRGDVKTIVEFHQKYQAPLAHLKLSTERRHNLENRNKSPAPTVGGVSDMSGKKVG